MNCSPKTFAFKLEWSKYCWWSAWSGASDATNTVYGILTQLKQISCRAATAEVTVECDKWCIDSHNYSSQHCTFRLVHGMFTSENTICYPPSSRMRILAYRKPLHVQCLQNADIGISDVQLLLECGDWLVGRHQVTETQQQNINYQDSDC